MATSSNSADVRLLRREMLGLPVPRGRHPDVAFGTIDQVLLGAIGIGLVSLIALNAAEGCGLGA
jgi:hypothetical protein